MKKKKVILAYSGGLDTSVILKWLARKGYEAICFVGDVGQKDDFSLVEKKALQTGASKVYVEDLKKQFVTDYIFPALKANAIYEGRYLLGTALARPLLAEKQIAIAEKEKAVAVAHGSTGKGNDQIRFEFAYYALNPKIEIISPWKDKEFLKIFAGRTDLINYAKKWKIPVKVNKKKPYSEDENLMHISHEAGMLEDPVLAPKENIFCRTAAIKDTPEQPSVIELHFRDGVPIKVVDKKSKKQITDPLKLFDYLNQVGSQHGVGRLDMVENRFIGIKSRGVYETPGATILWLAHRDLEGIAMDKEVMHLRDMLAPKLAELIYNGFWFSPEMDFLLAAINKSQEAISGKVVLKVGKGAVRVLGRKSPTSLYDQKMSSMDKEGGFSPEDARGFININALRLKAHHFVLKKSKPYNWRNK